MARKKKPGQKYKLKTHKSTAKRFKMTGTGKIMHTKGGQSHFRRRTSKRTRMQFTKMKALKGSGFQKRVKRLAPYMKKYKANPTARTAK